MLLQTRAQSHFSHRGINVVSTELQFKGFTEFLSQDFWMHFECEFWKLLSPVMGDIYERPEKCICFNFQTLFFIFVSIPLSTVSCHASFYSFFPSENGNPSVPGKVSKASSTTTKRSIADSEDKSEAYKSIFTTHSSAKRSKEECSNWVTHTAYYFWNNEEPQWSSHCSFPPPGLSVQLWYRTFVVISSCLELLCL